jgi:YVTN family beta-propeller protein
MTGERIMRPASLGICSLVLCSLSFAEQGAPLVLETKIPLGDVQGRIDHLAVDAEGQRLFVAALGNNTVEVVDLAKRKAARTLTGFDEPQGVAYSPTIRTLYVANGGDGSVHIFRGDELTPAGRIKLGADADNVRVDPTGRRIYVGYGDGALAVIDQSTHQKIADIPLKGHPESFQLEKSGSRIFVNVPDAGEIAIVDRPANRQIAGWPTRELHANYPMALDEANQRVLAVFRRPAVLAIYTFADGAEKARIPTCGDADDVFVDEKRGYVYVSCGEGFIDILARRDETYARAARVKTVPGARTALFSPDLGRLFLAARARASEPEAVWVFRVSE